MLRTQLYLPDQQYAHIKKYAEKQNVSFAEYVRVLIHQDEVSKNEKLTIQEKYPFIGMFKWGKHAADNEAIDKFLLDQHGL